MARVDLEHLSKDFPGKKGQVLRAVNDLSLAVQDKEWLVVVGPSASGKTTTLRLIAGLDKPTDGQVRLDGRSQERVLPQDRNIAMVFQTPALYPHLTIFENIGFGLALRNCPRSELQQRVKWAADLLGISDCLDRKPMALSGGQRQRAAIGRALVRRPEVLLLDEPLGNLDTPTRAQLRIELMKLRETLTATVVHVTHDQAEAMTMGDRVAVLDRGTLQQLDRPTELYRRPANLFVAGFIGFPPMNLFRGALTGDGQHFAFKMAGGESWSWSLRCEEPLAHRLGLYGGKEIVLGLRPEDILPAGTESAGPMVEATVEIIQDLGAQKHLHLRTAGNSFTASFPAGTPARPQDTLQLCFNLDRARFFDAASGQAIL